MAIQELHTFPQFSQFDITTQLGPTKLTLKMTYRERTGSWYIDIYELNGTPLVLGKRLSPYWSPLFGNAVVPELIDGVLFVRGIEGYKQADLGTESLLLWYIPSSDFAFFDIVPTDPLVTTTITSP